MKIGKETKNLHQLGSSQVCIIPADWLKANGSPKQVTVNVEEHKIEITPAE